MSEVAPDPDTAVYLWAAVGSASAVPDRVLVLVCKHCGALVAVARADVHSRWHRSLGDT